MASLHRLDITVQDVAQTVIDQMRLTGNPADGPQDIARLGEWLVGRAGGMQGTGITVAARFGGTQATGTLTLAAVVATDTISINGTTFTCVASGATANQFNIGGSDTITATNMAAAINASVTTTVKGVVTATSSGVVVTLTSAVTGNIGNAITQVGGAHITASTARLIGGTDGTAFSLQRG